MDQPSVLAMLSRVVVTLPHLGGQGVLIPGGFVLTAAHSLVDEKERTLLDDDYPRGLLWPFVEQNQKIFKCPNGVDTQPGSATFGRAFQVSYAMNYVSGGPNGKKLTELANGTSNVIIVWDHG